MPTLPTLVGQDVPVEPSSGVATYNPDIISGALKQGGSDLNDAAVIAQRTQHIQAMQDVMQRKMAVEKQVTNYFYGDGTPDNPGAFSKTGANARGTGDNFNQFFDGVQAKAADGISNPMALNTFNNELAQMRDTGFKQARQFEFTQQRDYSGNLLQTQVAQSAQHAAVDYNNEVSVAHDMQTAGDASQQYAVMHGGAQGPTFDKDGNTVTPGDEIWKAAGQDGKSAVAVAHLNSMYSSKDPATISRAMDLTDKYLASGDMNMKAIDTLTGMQKTALPQVTGYRAFQELQNRNSLNALPTEKLADAMQQQESRGQMYNKSGGVLTSPTGAMGLMQIGPSSKGGPAGQLAERLGVTENQVLTDPKINRQAGEIYIGDLQKQFGDNNLAALAYNAGPGMVQDWIDGTNKTGKNNSGLQLGDPTKPGGPTMDAFLKAVPFKESRDYVTAVKGFAGSGGSINPKDASDFIKTIPLIGQKDAEDYVNNYNGQVAAQRDMQSKNVVGQALQAYNGGAKWQDLPVPLRTAAIQNGFGDELRNYNPKAPSDPSTLGYLYTLDPGQIVKTDLSAPGTRLSLSQSDYDAWTKKQTLLNSNPAAGDTAQTVHAMMMTAAKKADMPMRNTMDSEGNPKMEGGVEFVRASQLVQQKVDAFTTAHNGKFPETSQVQGMVDDVFTNPVHINGGWFGWGKKDVPQYQYGLKAIPGEPDGKTDVIPDDAKKVIEASLLNKGMSLTDANMIDAYITSQRKANAPKLP